MKFVYATKGKKPSYDYPKPWIQIIKISITILILKRLQKPSHKEPTNSENKIRDVH